MSDENIIRLKKRPPAERIALAIGLVRSVEREMNTTYRVCGECELKHYANLEELKMANKLKGVGTTLTNVLERMGQ